jgi:hypothetical protein
MSASHATPVPIASLASRFLFAGLAGLAITAAGFLLSPPAHVALAYLVAVCYWVAVCIGMLLLIFIHHIMDSGWSTVIRRQWEHSLAAFPWLLLLFLP